MAQASGDFTTPKKLGGGARFNGFWRRRPAKTPGAVQPSSRALEDDGELVSDPANGFAYSLTPPNPHHSQQHQRQLPVAKLGEVPVDPRLSFRDPGGAGRHARHTSHQQPHQHSSEDDSDEASRNPLNSSSFGFDGLGGPQLFDSPGLHPRPLASSAAAQGVPHLSTLNLDDDDFAAVRPVDPAVGDRLSPSVAGRQSVLGGHMDSWNQNSQASGAGGISEAKQGAGSASTTFDGQPAAAVTRNTPRLAKYMKLLEEPHVDLASLRELGWKGIPGECRDTVWKLLLGYLPAHKARRAAVQDRRRAEYQGYLEQYFNTVREGAGGRSETEQALYRQIMVDVPRTLPHSRFFQSAPIQRSLERVLYTWGIRHPASGYVQGINDLATPFYLVFASAVCGRQVMDTPCGPELLSEGQLQVLEADVFWCVSKLLDWIQDHYIFAQPGIQRMIFKIQELVGRIDAELYQHLAEQQLEFIQFAFRWVNCLLLRELSLPLIVRVWDTYLCEDTGGAGFQSFHAYVCAALLIQWSSQLKRMSFSELIVFLQHLPTQTWDIKHIETLLSQAYVYKTLYDESPAHLQ